MLKRITINKKDDELAITILAFKDKGKQTMLLVWISLFSLCGIAIISQFFGNYNNNTKIFFGVYIAFWLFFEFKVIYAYRWRKSGLEFITVTKDKLMITKEIGKRGITQSYLKNEITNLRIFENADNNFIKSMTTSYWNINKYTLAFDFENQVIPFAIDLTKNEANKILLAIKTAM